jgi:hypothetical protein
MKGGFELIALGLLQVLDRSVNLLPPGSTHDSMGTSIHGDQAHLAHRAMARTRQKHGHNPEIAFSHEPLGILAQAAERIVANDVTVSGLQDHFRLANSASAPTGCRRPLLLLLHGRYPFPPKGPRKNKLVNY